MVCNAVFEEIDALFPTYLSFLEEVCNIESPTDYKPGVDATAEAFLRIARERGWETEVLEEPVAGNVACITLNPGAKGAPICLSGHLDTVHPVGMFPTPAVRIEGDKIYGPGTSDCKGGAVAALLAMDALDRSGYCVRPVRLLLQTDEERGSRPSQRRTINYICEKAKDAVAFLNLEPHVAGTACIARKGINTYTFTVKGVAAHASLCATRGANAILEAAHKIIELEKYKDDEGLTCVCTVIEAGTTTNTIPDTCVFKADVRFATREQMESMREYARRVAETVYVPGCQTTVTYPQRGRIMMEKTPRNLALLEKLNQVFAENGLPVLQPYCRNGGSDAADVTEAGIPCIDSLGIEGGDLHAPGEFAYIESLRTAARRIVAACYMEA